MKNENITTENITTEVEKPVLSQYRQSSSINALMDSYMERTGFAHIYNMLVYSYMDIRTACGAGLDNWGRILGISRNIKVKVSSFTNNRFMFDSLAGIFGRFVFSSVNDVSAGNIHVLDDERYRELLYLKAAANITNHSVPSINKVLRAVYKKRGRAFIIETGAMQVRLIFDFYLTPLESAMVANSDIIPLPAGVGADIMEYTAATFGFYCPGADKASNRWATFDCGHFGRGAVLKIYD